MRYQDAVDALANFKYVRRDNEEWKKEGAYLGFMPGLTAYFKVIQHPKPTALAYLADQKDSLADDWKEVTVDEILLPKVE